MGNEITIYPPLPLDAVTLSLLTRLYEFHCRHDDLIRHNFFPWEGTALEELMELRQEEARLTNELGPHVRFLVTFAHKHAEFRANLWTGVSLPISIQYPTFDSPHTVSDFLVVDWLMWHWRQWQHGQEIHHVE